MKKLSFLSMAAFGLLFAACSSDKDVADNGGVAGPLEGKGEGYFKIGINLPTQAIASTRAWNESSNLDDGLKTEYAVENVLLLLFDGDKESTATLVQTVPLVGFSTGETWETQGHEYSDTPAQVTARKDFVVKLENNPSNNLYALAIVNTNNIVAAGTATNKVSINGDTEVAGPTLSALQAQVKEASTAVGSNKFIYTSGSNTYFFMANAVLSDTKGGTVEPKDAKVTTLAPVNASLIYETESAANTGAPAVDIYVERGVAKVTIEKSTESGNEYLGVSGLNKGTKLDGTVAATLLGWTLDNTNQKSFIVRNVPATPANIWQLKSVDDTNTSASDKYRFVGGNPVDPAVSLYRTYWAQDPNYDAAWATGNFSKAGDPTITAIGSENPQYCLENTFDVQRQTYKNTTRALLKVRLAVKGTTGVTFYTVGADHKTLYGETDVNNLIVSYIEAQPTFQEWFAKKGTGTLTADDADATKNIAVKWSSNDAGKITVTEITIPKDNMSSGSAFTITSSTDDTYDTGKNLKGSDLLSTLNNTQLVAIERFKNGVSYYAIRIKHFGDDLTPWNKAEYGSGDKPAESSWDKIYPNESTREANYLGRYGMVRNNWYELVIGAIQKIGSSTPPSISAEGDTDHPDDNLDDLYIKARINILSWAKRTQSWNLK